MIDESTHTTQVRTYGTCPRCLKKYRIANDGRIYDHGHCWGGGDLPLESSPESLENSLANLTRKHQDRLKRQAAGEILRTDELEKLNTRPALISDYQNRIAQWKPGKLEQRSVQVKRRKKAAPTVKQTCGLCGLSVKVKKDGNLGSHRHDKGGYCMGEGLAPLEQSADQYHEIRTELANEIATARMYLTHDLARKPVRFIDQINGNREILLQSEQVQREHGYQPKPLIVGSLFLEDGEKPRSTGLEWSAERVDATTKLIEPEMSDFEGLNVQYVPYGKKGFMSKHYQHQKSRANLTEREMRAVENPKRGFWARLFGLG